MALRLVPEILDTVNMRLIGCKEFGMIDPEENVAPYPINWYFLRRMKILASLL